MAQINFKYVEYDAYSGRYEVSNLYDDSIGFLELKDRIWVFKQFDNDQLYAHELFLISNKLNELNEVKK